MSATSADVAAAITAAARTMNVQASLEATLAAIVEAARLSIPGFDNVGISTLEKDGTFVTRAGAGDLVLELDRLQYEAGEGPCIEAMTDSQVHAVPHIRHEQRWPRFVPSAVALGLRSQLAVQLHLDGNGTIGGLNLYSTISDEIEPEAQHIAELFATHAAIALSNAEEVAGLNDALVTRKVIGQALGIVMERYDLTEDEAFAFLTRASNHGNIKLRDIARRIVEDRGSSSL